MFLKFLTLAFLSLYLLQIQADDNKNKVKKSSNLSPICLQPVKVGPCDSKVFSFFYNHTKGRCESFEYGGCAGNDNRFISWEQCERICGDYRDQDHCNQPAEGGVCNADFPKYYFNKTSRTCQEFSYGGCGGNGNKFDNPSECESVCIHHKEPGRNETSSVCDLPADSGICLASFRNYYYDKTTRTCKEFTYGGCGGNANRFNTPAECESACGHHN